MSEEKGGLSIVDSGMTLEGKLRFTGRMVVRGTVRGTVVGETVVIGQDGEMHADVKAGSMTIGGVFEGKIRAMRELIILPTGSCAGKVICRDLVVEPGGILNAEVTRLALNRGEELRDVFEDTETGAEEAEATGKKGAASPGAEPQGREH